MNVEKLNKIIKKYKSNYYHNTSIYERQYESEKNEFANCDHIEIVYDLLDCNIKEEDIDFIWDNNTYYDKNIYILRKYIRKLELVDNNIKKALIHLAWMFQIKEKSITKMFIKYKEYDKIFVRYGQTFVEFNIRSYKADLKFRKTCEMYDGMMKAINDDYQKQLKLQKEKQNS